MATENTKAPEFKDIAARAGIIAPPADATDHLDGGAALSPEEAAEVEADEENLDPTLRERLAEKASAAPDTAAPAWATIPEGLKIPPGRRVAFIRFKAEWTDSPQAGDRQCILWSLNSSDEKLALTRSRGDALRTIAELSKAMIRAVDGHKVNWSKTKNNPGDVDVWWDAIGARCREVLQGYYVKTHSLSVEEKTDFFANCIVVVSSV